MKNDSNYYVYAYFDPRNYEMFYVGKGRGSRKDAHRSDKAGTPKERRIDDIKKAGKKPDIKVIVINLTDKEALLVEAALMWRPRESLTNLNRGNYVDNFRRPDTLHKSLPGFDTARGIFFVNAGAELGSSRKWEDCYDYNFLAAGGGRQYSSQLYRLSVGDIVAAFITKEGYVGIGQVVAPPVPSRSFRFNGRPLAKCKLKGPEFLHDEDDEEKCEHLVGIEWIRKLPRDDARFLKNAGLYAKQPIVASLSNQPKTRQFLEQEFGVNFENLLAED